ncbi:hypothetical protein [Streptomyces griseocarneus]|uniref:hypothetical protein n=1 Tax=Streptomyces griseocarneus TaxID=51201 RepID=UPI00167EA3EA|nr:hypothetical protein [Streptomyces griseocarneus]MBZ6475078.1 hypothetical protein [Streptomyces griseocarneus]GHG62377.1 hypothetical protein GCM10018779_31030 [Streptomyces griseocarneus]
MDRRTRMRIALTSTFPTLLTLPLCCLLAAVGAAPWDILLALPVALTVHAVINFIRLGPRLPAADAGRSRTL